MKTYLASGVALPFEIIVQQPRHRILHFLRALKPPHLDNRPVGDFTAFVSLPNLTLSLKLPIMVNTNAAKNNGIINALITLMTTPPINRVNGAKKRRCEVSKPFEPE